MLTYKFNRNGTTFTFNDETNSILIERESSSVQIPITAAYEIAADIRKEPCSEEAPFDYLGGSVEIEGFPISKFDVFLLEQVADAVVEASMLLEQSSCLDEE